MALYGQGFSLRSLLEDPNLRNPPNLNKGSVDLKKGGKLGGYTPNLSSAFLGSNLWEKPSHDNNNGNDFDLEYMDLDEFLSENGIPVNPDENDESQTISLLASALARSPSRDSNPGSPGLLIDPISPGNPRPVPVGDELDKMGSFSNISSPAGQPTSPVSQMLGSPQACKVENTSQSVIERYLLDDDFGIKLPSPKAEKKPEIKENNRKRKVSAMDYPVESPDMSIVSIPVYQQHSPSVRSLQSLPSPHWDPAGPEYDNEDSCSNDGEMMNSLVPGQDGFDPTARKFSVEELKPQPIIKKAKKVFVDDSAKDEKYWQRRKKNNVAAKRSREARRVKENQIAMRAAFLEQECDKLRKSYEKLQRENEGLVKRLSKYEPVE